MFCQTDSITAERRLKQENISFSFRATKCIIYKDGSFSYPADRLNMRPAQAGFVKEEFPWIY